MAAVAVTSAKLLARGAADEAIEELSLQELEEVKGGFLWILAWYYSQMAYVKAKKKDEQDDEEIIRRVIAD